MYVVRSLTILNLKTENSIQRKAKMKVSFLMVDLLVATFFVKAESYKKKIDDEKSLEEILDKDINDEELYEEDEFSDERNDPSLTRIIRFNSRRRCSYVRLPTCNTLSNGCGPEVTQSRFGHVDYINKELFTPSCNKHDNCYDCHTEHGWKRTDCDLRFKKDMESRCDCHYNDLLQQPARLICLAQANIMSSAVAAGGGFFIDKTNNAFCYKDCVDRIGNPNRVIDH